MFLVNGKDIDYPGADKYLVRDIRFRPGMPNTSRRTKPVRMHGLHWTGGEGRFSTTIAVLKDRKCSITFVVPTYEHEGKVMQTADLHTRVSHIGSPWNDAADGTEITCRGFASKDDWAKAAKLDPTLRERDEIDWKIPRDVYTDIIDDRSVNMAMFTPGQIEAAVWLCEALAHIRQYKRIIPYDEITKATRDRPTPLGDRTLGDIAVKHEGKLYVPSFVRDERPRGRFAPATSEGAIGHFNVHPTKNDPGTAIFYKLWSRGWNPAQQEVQI
jgi:hypothetical protein